MFNEEGKKVSRERGAEKFEQSIVKYSNGLFDCDCIAADTEVLTNNGWKTIVEVLTTDLVWDGVEFVKHDGVVSKGVSDTINFGGVGITPDHLVLIDGRWVDAGVADHDLAARSYSSQAALDSPPREQVERQEVFDLLNAGPRTRFTVRGSDGRPFIIHNCACADAPDTGAVADASVEAAKISAQLGQDQLTEARRQYDLNKAVVDPVVETQRGLMQQQIDQGDEYYDYMKETFRPLERSMVSDAEYESSDARLEEAAGMAAADTRRGLTQQANMMIRQGLRYGYSPSKMASMAGEQATNNATAVAGATTGAREKQRAVGYAKKLDAVGIGRGLPGASQGAYGLAVNSGNSAVNNQMQPGTALQSGMASAAGTTMQGQGIKVQGLGSVLDAQTSYASAMNAMQSGSSAAGLGGLLGGAASMYSAFKSDPRLKEDVVFVGVDAKTGLNVYEFKYRTGDTRYRGVMADEVEKVMPEAVERNDYGFASVDYQMLGMEMVEVANV
jgi:hypothetical protein